LRVLYFLQFIFLAEWLPPNERSRYVAFVWSGCTFGIVLSMLFIPEVIRSFGWPIVFYGTSAFGCLWCVLWQIFGASSPNDSRWITASEKQHIVGTIPNSQTPSFPWKKMCRSPAIWAIFSNHFAVNWGVYVLLTWLPTFLNEELGFDLERSGMMGLFPFLAMFGFTLFAGRAADWMLDRSFDVTMVRKIFQSLATLPPAITFTMLCFKPSVTVTVILLIFTAGCFGFETGGYGANAIDVAPRYAGVLFGISNAIATLPGIVGVVATGFILQSTNSWCAVFLLSATVCISGTIIWLLFATGKKIFD